MTPTHRSFSSFRLSTVVVLSLTLKEVAALPLEKRYVWRVASTLKWAFADFDSMNMEADRQTL